MNDRTVADAGRFEVRAFGKDILVYAAGNGILLLFGFLQALIIPKYLSVAGYGYWQLFNLYSNYVGILALGFLDGLLVRWAGKDLNQIGGEIKPAIRFLVLEQLAVIIPLGLITFFLLHPPLQWIGLMIFVYAFIMNLATFFIFTAQAIRRFWLLTALNVVRGLVFLLLVVLLFTSGHLEYHYVIVVFLVSFVLFIIALAVRYRRYLWGDHSPAPSPVSLGRKNINTGIFILLGNFVFLIFWTLDRLLVSSFFAIEQFAVYAFASAVAQIAVTFIGAIASVLFPHLSAAAPEQRTRTYQVGKCALILCWAAFLGAYFPLTALIEFYLPHYTGSLPIIKILFGSLGFFCIVRIMQVTYFKMYGRQRQYLLYGISVLAFAVLLALTAIKMLGTLESVAIVMLISFFVWYIINSLSLKSVTGESGRKIGKDLMIMGCYFVAFCLASYTLDWLLAGMIVYYAFFLLITWIFLLRESKELLAVVKALITKSGKGEA